MSLDICAKLKRGTISSGQQLGTGYIGWSREERVRLTEPTDEVLWINITHNLGKMASHVPIEFTDKDGTHYDTDLYHIMWRPEEVFNKEEIVLNDLKRPLKIALEYILSMEEELSEDNPENGWGHYENFVHCLPEYIRACYKWPDAVLEIDR